MNQPLYGGMPSSSSIRRRRQLADALLSNATDASPVGHWTQALARGLQGGIAGWQNRKADKEEGTRSQALADALQGGKTPEQLMAMGAQYDAPELMQAAEFGANQSYRNQSLGLDREKFDYERNKPPEPIKVGNSLLDPNTYQPIYEGGPNTLVNTTIKGDNEYDKTRSKYFAETANTLDTEERGAVNSLNSLSALEQQMADPNFSSGFMAGNLLNLQKAAVAMGIADPSAVTSKEAFNSLSSKAALDNMGGSLGTGFSNADREFVVNQVANMGNTPGGNQVIIGIHKKIAQRKVEIARLARQYEAENGRLDNGFMNELSQWAQDNPLFPNVGQGEQPQPTSDIDPLLDKYAPKP